MAGAFTVFIVQIVMQLANVVLDETVVADLIAAGLDAVLFALLAQCGLIQMQQLTRFVDGIEFVQFFVVYVRDIKRDLTLLKVNYVLAVF